MVTNRQMNSVIFCIITPKESLFHAKHPLLRSSFVRRKSEIRQSIMRKDQRTMMGMNAWQSRKLLLVSCSLSLSGKLSYRIPIDSINNRLVRKPKSMFTIAPQNGFLIIFLLAKNKNCLILESELSLEERATLW